MRVDPDGTSERERRLLAVLASYYDVNEDGTAPDPRALINGHPEFAEELAEFFALQEHLHHLAAPIRELETMPAIPAPATDPDDSRAADASRIRRRASIGDYDLLAEIARGGVGIVYRARQRRLNRPVAVKVLRDGPYAAPADAQRFRNEAETVAKLDHPNIVPIYEVGEEGGCSYFSMRLIEGGSLADRTEEYAADPRRAARLMAAVARAIHHAHERGILHRDLKPSNILIDDRGEPIVADFGLARRLDTDGGLTGTGLVVGTPSYMAPEQASGGKKPVTAATDVHGLGTILYFLLTDRPPYGGSTVLDILERARAASPKPPSTIRRAVDRDLETICLKCLEPEAAGRYPSAAAVADDLERWLEGRPILARRAGWVEHAWRFCRRRPRMAGLVAVALALLFTTLAGLIASTRDRQVIAALDREVQWRDRVLRAEQYARDIALAGQAWADNHRDRAVELLDRHRPAPGEEDLRGFVWHYFHRLCRVGRSPLLGHSGEVYCAAFSPDGNVLATAGQDRTARLWDAGTGRRRLILDGHTDELNWVSISAEGRTLATASDDETVKLWDAGMGRSRPPWRDIATGWWRPSSPPTAVG